MRLVVTWQDGALKASIAKLDAAAAGAMRTAMTRVVGEIGAEAHQAILGPLEHQTGLHRANRIQRAVHDEASGLTYSLRTEGGNIALKYFGAHEGGGGVTANPRDTPAFYAGAFTKSGRPGQRAFSAKLGKQVYRNVAGGRWGGKIVKVKSGVFIPQEMVRGATAAAFTGSVERGFARALPGLMTQLI